jgi:ribosomal protein S18 acetylase RimI-like enzyme
MGEVEPGWRLTLATDEELAALMGWFPDGPSVRVWGGPAFRYPFDPASFRKDCLWDSLARFALAGPDGDFCGFGQLYEHLGRVHLARLAVRPDRRGQGVGRCLVLALLDAGRTLWPHVEASLYVYRHNAPALACYESVGFRIAPFPAVRAEMADECFFMTLPLSRTRGQLQKFRRN